MLTMSQINNIIDVSIKNDKNTKGIYTMINQFFDTNNIFEKESIILTLIYLKRYKKNTNNINKNNIKDLIETCLILSNKFICDFQISGSGPLENHVLDKINWNLYVCNDEYENVKKLTMLNSECILSY
tara:strand:- start:145 stop:528 length:384 start_codon:yes stop_codon:yes gene_type:complete